MSELKPCPFCGSKDISLDPDSRFGFWAQCGDCSAAGPFQHLKHEAIEAWNERKPTVIIDESFIDRHRLLEKCEDGTGSIYRGK